MDTCPKVESKEHKLSPWVTLVEKSVSWGDQRGVELYHALSQADYVSVLAVASDGRIPLVRQYRPGCGEFTLELPGGLLEAGEEPSMCVRRELEEEVGCIGGQLRFIGVLWADTGRLMNRLHCFMAEGVVLVESGWQKEAGLERQFVDKAEFKSLVKEGRLSNSQHIAVVGLAFANGFLEGL